MASRYCTLQILLQMRCWQGEKNTAGLLGTRYTMEQDFYKSRLERRGIRFLVPESEDREYVNRVIYQELCLGRIEQDSIDHYKKV